MSLTARELLAGNQHRPVIVYETILTNTAAQDPLLMDHTAGALSVGAINRDVELLSNGPTKFSDGYTRGAGRCYDSLLSGLQLRREIGKDFEPPALPALAKFKLAYRDGNGPPEIHKRGFKGAAFTVKVGGKADSEWLDYRDYPTLLTGHNKTLSGNARELLVGLENTPLSLYSLFPLGTYSGLGALEGTKDLTGQARPFGVGLITNATPDDLGGGLYHYHDGNCRTLQTVRRKNGTPLTLSQKTSAAEVQAATPGENTAVYSLDGYIKVDPESVDQITVDYIGASFTESAGKTQDNLAGIIGFLLTLVTGSEVTLNHPATSPDIGYLFTERRPLIEHLQTLAVLCGYDLLHNDDSTLTLTRRYTGEPVISEDSNPLSAPVLTEQTIIEESLNRQPALPVVERLRIGYRRNWTPADGDEVLSAYKKELTRVADWRESTSGAVAESREEKHDSPIVTPLIHEHDAAELASLAGFLGSERIPYRFNAIDVAWQIREGDLLTVDHFAFVYPRFWVWSVTEDTHTGITSLYGINVL